MKKCTNSDKKQTKGKCGRYKINSKGEVEEIQGGQ